MFCTWMWLGVILNRWVESCVPFTSQKRQKDWSVGSMHSRSHISWAALLVLSASAGAQCFAGLVGVCCCADRQDPSMAVGLRGCLGVSNRWRCVGSHQGLSF